MMSVRPSPVIERLGAGSIDPTYTNTFRVAHSLNHHHLLSLEAIADLAEDLSSEWVEHGSQNAAQIVGFEYTRNQAPENKRETVLGIAGTDRIVYLDHIETVPRYRALVDELAPTVMDILNLDAADVVKTEGYMFISGGPSTTMAHVDHECNILMVLEGTKRVWLSDIPDPDADRAVEAMYAGGYGSCDRMPGSMRPYDVSAGEGIFIAPRAAHMIENHPGRCVALSIVVTPASLEEEGRIFRANARLRALGLRPKGPGVNGTVDAVKQLSEKSLARLRGR